LHPIAAGWVKLRLDQNSITPHQEWSIPKDRLIASEDEDASRGLIGMPGA
jgi:hypothetical protein